jgi:hypothetical protein
MLRRWISALLVVAILISLHFAFAEDFPYRFVAFGDSGCGCSDQAKVATRLVQWYRTNRYRTVLMLGDNIYGGLFGTRGGSKKLFSERFDKYYSPLLRDGVRFFATLGNHDYETNDGADEIADKERFHILGPNGYYAFKSDATVDGKPLVLFISLNSVDLIEKDASDKIQIQWLSKTLAENNSIWKVVYFHHPLYAPSGEGHEPSLNLRRSLEDVFVAAGVQLVLAGHNHYYARMKTQRGITHFISGGGGRDLKAPIQNEYTVKVAELPHFMYFEVFPDKMDFRMVPAYGDFTDAGTIPVTNPTENSPAAAPK